MFIIKKILLFLLFICVGCADKKLYMDNYVNKDINLLKEFCEENKIDLDIEYTYSYDIDKDKIISQNIDEGSELKENDKLSVVVSSKKISIEQLKKDKINELGKVPIMMYHSIVDMKNADTKYIGGNVDQSGYIRTTEAFKNDLEFYYQEGYRMISLDDYINGIIDVEYGKSPIIITFDDGRENNLKVTGLDDDGNIIIDPNSAVGILESFKQKYPDYNVTATFFVNEGLFNQSNYNDKILKWLVDNNYDIGNHTKGHIDISKKSSDEVSTSVGYIYDLLETIIPNNYLKIVALPFGSPYKKEHTNFNSVINSEYNNKKYETKSALRVGWEPELSPFNKDFDKTFLKRCRAYDNDGKEFDIQMVFKNLKKDKYISDGLIDVITISKDEKEKLINTNLKVIEY